MQAGAHLEADGTTCQAVAGEEAHALAELLTKGSLLRQLTKLVVGTGPTKCTQGMKRTETEMLFAGCNVCVGCTG